MASKEKKIKDSLNAAQKSSAAECDSKDSVYKRRRPGGKRRRTLIAKRGGIRQASRSQKEKEKQKDQVERVKGADNIMAVEVKEEPKEVSDVTAVTPSSKTRSRSSALRRPSLSSVASDKPTADEDNVQEDEAIKTIKRTPNKESPKESGKTGALHRVKKKLIGKRQSNRAGKLRAKRDGNVEVDVSVVKTEPPESPRTDAQFRMLRNGKPRADSPEPKKRRRLLSDPRASKPVTKNNAKIMKLDAKDAVMSDSEVGRQRRRSDSISKCSDTTDTSSFYDNPLMVKTEPDKQFVGKTSVDDEKETPSGGDAENNNSVGDEDVPCDAMTVKSEMTDSESSCDRIPEKLKILDKMAQTFNDVAVDNESASSKVVRRSARQRKSTQVKLDTSGESVDTEADTLVDVEELLHVDTTISKSPPPPVLEKAASLSPELKSQGVSHIHVKQFYEEPAFLENNLGIESDPNLGGVIGCENLPQMPPGLTQPLPVLPPLQLLGLPQPPQLLPQSPLSLPLLVKEAAEDTTTPVESSLESVSAEPVQMPQIEEIKEIECVDVELEEEKKNTKLMNLLESNMSISIIKEPPTNERRVSADALSIHPVNVARRTSGSDATLGTSLLPPAVELPILSPNNLNETDDEVIQTAADVEVITDDEAPKLEIEIIKCKDIALVLSAPDVVAPTEMDQSDFVKPKVFRVDEVKAAVTSAAAAVADDLEIIKLDEVEMAMLHAMKSSTPDLKILETPESQIQKENILNALGLLTLKAASEAKIEKRRQKEQLMAGKMANKSDNNYTGTLKIKLHRDRAAPAAAPDKRKGRCPLKMTFQKGRGKYLGPPTGDKHTSGHASGSNEDLYYTIQNEIDGLAAEGQSIHQTSTDLTLHGGNIRKSHYRSYTDPSPPCADVDPLGDSPVPPEPGKALVIPEKASSFSIHPGRLCRDQCYYCGGKFGLFDTPCHVAQIKSVERQKKILDNEEKLTVDNCLCDACYRHVDRRANCPSYRKRTTAGAPSLSDMRMSLESNEGGSLSEPPTPPTCHVAGCCERATNSVRRKWMAKMKKSVAKIARIEFDNTTMSLIPLCGAHYNSISHLMVCSMCKRRLTRSHINYIGSDTPRLQTILSAQGLPVDLGSMPAVCKLCRYYASMLLKHEHDAKRMPKQHFFKSYRRKLLQIYNIELVEDSEVDEIETVTEDDCNLAAAKKLKTYKKKPNKNTLDVETDLVGSAVQSESVEKNSELNKPKEGEEDIENLISKNTKIPLNNSIDTQTNYKTSGGQLLGSAITDQNKIMNKLKHVNQPSLLLSKQQNLLSRKLKLDQILGRGDVMNQTDILRRSLNQADNKTDHKVTQLRGNSSISVRELFPGEEDMGLVANIPLNYAGPKTPEGWTKCMTTVQYDDSTRRLWNELQKPYGNQSSFLRHLVLLEKYFRNGDLVLSQSASYNAMNYSESVQNRLRSFDNLPTDGVESVPTPLSSRKGVKATKLISGNMSVQAPIKNISQMLPPPLQPMPALNEMLKKAINRQTSVEKSLVKIAPKPAQEVEQISLLKPVQQFAKPLDMSKLHRTQSLPPELISIGSKPTAVAKPVAPKSVAAKPVAQTAPVTANVANGTKTQVPMDAAIRKQKPKPWRPTLIPIVPGSEQPNPSQLFQTVDGRRLPSLVQVMSGGQPYHISIQDYNRMCILRRDKFAQMQKNQLLQKMKADKNKSMAENQPLDPKQKQKAVAIPNKVLEQNSLIPLKYPEAKPRKSTNQTSLLKNIPLINKNITVGTKTSTATANSPNTVNNTTSAVSIIQDSSANIWATWENLKGKLQADAAQQSVQNQDVLPFTKIPKSLTVIPQNLSLNRANPTSPNACPNVTVVPTLAGNNH